MRAAMQRGEMSDTDKAITHFHLVPPLSLEQLRRSKVKISLLDVLLSGKREGSLAGRGVVSTRPPLQETSEFYSVSNLHLLYQRFNNLQLM